jgi:hypothetical protein
MTEQSAPSFKLWWLSINTIRIVILCSSSPSRVCASLFITIVRFRHYVSISVWAIIQSKIQQQNSLMIRVVFMVLLSLVLYL